ncbi:MAG: hypothetical protein KJZ69_09305 [Phycisphaerales bacterium]|nr:hypothetical protein [Phycisphaerales bacterium]
MSKSRENSRIGGRSSGIALLAASTIVLAAAGETMWHANASASEGRWAGPGVGSAAAGASTPAAITSEASLISEAALAAERASAATALASAAETEGEVESMTTPIFKPFVMVRIPLPSGYTHGEVLGLNNSNQAVGWMHHQSSGKARPFVFDPALISTDPANAVSILDFATDTDSGKAYAISDADPPVIVGSLYYTPEAIDRAASWEVDGDFIAFYYDSETPSAAQGINADERVVGYYQYADEPYSFVIEGANNWNPAAASHSAAHGVNASGKVVGWHEVSAKSHAYSWVSNTTTDINPSGYDYSSALSINSAGHIGGWVADTDEEEKIAALWTFVIPGVYTVEPFDTGASSAVTAINASGEMAITREDASGVAIWSKRSGVDDADLLDDLTLMPAEAAVLHSAWAINDNGWIGGSYIPVAGNDPLPCLIIPYDVDNDGTPDYREILDGKREGYTDLDTDSNWLLDWAETVRVGINNPGYQVPAYNPAHDIQNTCVVSLPVHIGALPEDATEDDYAIEDVLSGGVSCEDYRTAIEHWARATQGDPQEREVSILLRSSLGAARDEDYLPEDDEQRAQLLANIHNFAYELAWCIDYIQTGNEVFGGAGGYLFYETDLPTCGQSHSWEGALTFPELPSDNCRKEGVDLVIAWLDDQAWAALEGSALAGRPLRILGPGITHGMVINAADDPPMAAALYVMEQVVPWLNANQMHFDMHLHYRSIEDAETAIAALTDTDPNWGEEVLRRVSKEFGPAATDQWAGNNLGEFYKFRDDYTTQGPCSSSCCQEQPSDGTWDNFTVRWRDEQFNEDFEMGYLLGLLDSGGWTFIAYGPVHQESPHAMVFDVAALRANRICWEWMDQQNRSQTTRFTPLTDEFTDEAENFSLTFPQNRRTCPECE